MIKGKNKNRRLLPEPNETLDMQKGQSISGRASNCGDVNEEQSDALDNRLTPRKQMELGIRKGDSDEDEASVRAERQTSRK